MLCMVSSVWPGNAPHRKSRRGATRVPFQAGPLCPVSRLLIQPQPKAANTHIMLCMCYTAKGSTHDVMHGEQCMAWQRTAPEIPKRSYTRVPFKAGPLCPVSRLLIQPQATNTHDVMHGEQWPATAAAVEHALHRHPTAISRRGATRVCRSRPAGSAARLPSPPLPAAKCVVGCHVLVVF